MYGDGYFIHSGLALRTAGLLILRRGLSWSSPNDLLPGRGGGRRGRRRDRQGASTRCRLARGVSCEEEDRGLRMDSECDVGLTGVVEVEDSSMEGSGGRERLGVPAGLTSCSK